MGLDSKKDVHLDGSSVGSVSRLEILEGPSGRRVRSEAERVRIAAESLLPGAQVSEVARKHGATRWQIYDWRRRFRMAAPCANAANPSARPHTGCSCQRQVAKFRHLNDAFRRCNVSA